MTKKYCLIVLLLMAFSFVAAAQKADAILATWVNPNGDDHMLIYKKGNKFFGKLDWIQFPSDETGKMTLDGNSLKIPAIPAYHYLTRRKHGQE